MVMHRWQRILPPRGTPAPPARSGASMCADEDASMLYLFGGLGHVRRGVKKSREGVPGAMMRVRMLVARDTHSDLWVFDAATGAWEMMNFTAMSPPPRRGHTVSFSAGRHLREDRDDDSGGPGRGVDDGTSNASQHGDVPARHSAKRVFLLFVELQLAF